MKLSDYEVQVLFHFLSKQWIHYENDAMRAVMKRISDEFQEIEFSNSLPVIGEEDELAG